MTTKPDAPEHNEVPTKETPERQALLILEVLAGARSAPEAADALGISVNRYYQIEERAVESLIEGCRPRTRGPSRDYGREIDTLQREKKALQDECARYQALVRTAQRSLGVEPPPEKPKGVAKKRRRKPTVRALQAAGRLQSKIDSASPEKGD